MRTVLALLGYGLLSCGLTGCWHSSEAQSTETQSIEIKPTETKISSAISVPPPMTTEPDCLLPVHSLPEVPPPKALSGRLGLWVAHIDAQGRVIKAVGSRPNETFPLASTYKQAVLWALLKEYDAGRLSATERFQVTPQNQSLGAYPYDGTNVKELSRRMIALSDNTATDILHRRIGLKRVQDVADRLKLCQTRIILPTKDWWVMQTGFSDTWNHHPEWNIARGNTRAELAQQIDEDAQIQTAASVDKQLDIYFETRYDPLSDVVVHNISTPYEWGTLVAHEFLRPELSDKARRWQREVMSTGYGKNALTRKADIVAWGGKGGNGWKILTYSGYFQLKDGRRVVYAFMQHGSEQKYTMPNTRHAFTWINAAIDAVLGDKPKQAIKNQDTKKDNQHVKP